MAAEFCWTPLVSVEGTSFTIRPAKGVVERHSSLTVEVAFYPSYFSNCSGDFVGNVEGGNELTLHCEAQVNFRFYYNLLMLFKLYAFLKS